MNKINELGCITSELEPDLVLVTETWCNSEVNNAFLDIPGYELLPDLRKDRCDMDRGRGGGLLVYAKRGLQVLSIDSGADFMQHCKFVVRGVTFYLVYRSPNSPVTELTKLAELIRRAEKDCIIIGDFNLPQLDWKAGTARGHGMVVMDAVEDALMSQMVDFSTQVRGNILDLVITNMPERVQEVREEGRLGRSDHVMIVTEISVGKQARENQLPLPDWKKADWAAMKQELADRSWSRRVMASDTNTAWKMVKGKVEDLIRRHVPVRRRRNQNRPGWLSQDILRAIRKKKRVWKKVKNKVDKQEFVEQEKIMRNMIRNAKRKFKKKLADGNGGNKRPFFAYVKQKTRSRPSIGPLKHGGATVTENKEMATLLNRCFGEVFTREDSANIPDPAAMALDSLLDNIDIRVSAVKKKIRGLRAESAAGPDGVGPKILKELQEDLAPVLAHIFRRSLAEGTVPADWRKANVTPIFKKGSKGDPGNYRPVSLTSVTCKIMESVLRDSITEHLDRNRLIRSSQHGFMCNKPARISGESYTGC